MSFTNTQAQILKQHLDALRGSLAAQTKTRKPLDPPHAEILGSLINELGPQSCAAIAEAIALSRHTLNDCCPDDIDCICETMDKLDDLITASFENNTPPEGNWRELLAKLLEKLSPFFIEALINFLMQPQPPKRIPYASLNY